jgi:hypothetical protein
VALLAPHRLACLEKYALSSVLHTTRGDRFSPSLLCTLRPSEYQRIIDAFSSFICNFCMMLVMVKEADLNRIEVPGDHEVLDATALGRRLDFKRDTVLAYLSRILALSS